jgi:hypothetical protein
VCDSIAIRPLPASQTPLSLLSKAYTVISLFVTRYLYTQSIHKMRSTALTALFFALFALFSSGLPFEVRADNLFDFFLQPLRMLRRLLLKG